MIASTMSSTRISRDAFMRGSTAGCASTEVRMALNRPSRRPLFAVCHHFHATFHHLNGAPSTSTNSAAASVVVGAHSLKHRRARVPILRTWVPAAVAEGGTEAATANEEGKAEEREAISEQNHRLAAEFDRLKVGDNVTGSVASLTRYGAIVELESGLISLLHISNIRSARSPRINSKDLRNGKILAVGQEVKAVVKSLDKTQSRGGISTRPLDTDAQSNEDGLMPETERVTRKQAKAAKIQALASWAEARNQVVGQVVSGVVHFVAKYGAFIDLDGVIGLLHISEISSEDITDVDKVLKEGDKVKVMILGIDLDSGRVNLSTKKLEPTPGDMLRNPQLVFDKADEGH